MFYSIRIDETAKINASHLQNPTHQNSPMDFVFNETVFNTALFKQVIPHQHFVDRQTGKRLFKRHWTPEMKQFAQEKKAENPQIKKRFKLNYGSYILLALMILGTFMVVKESNENKAGVAAQKAKFEETRIPEKPEAGLVLYGQYYAYEKGGRIPTDFRFTWAKITNVQGHTYQLALGKEFSKKASNENTLNSTEFDEKTISLKIVSNNGLQCVFKSEDKVYEFNAQKKK